MKRIFPPIFWVVIGMLIVGSATMAVSRYLTLGIEESSGVTLIARATTTPKSIPAYTFYILEHQEAGQGTGIKAKQADGTYICYGATKLGWIIVSC